MSFDSMRDYLDTLRSKGLLEELAGVDLHLEVGAITEVVAFSDRPRALLFDEFAGAKPGFRVATNLYSSLRLQAIALGLPDDVSGVPLISAWREKSKTLTTRPPRVVTDGPVRENVLVGDQVDLTVFPVPFWHELDGGKFFGTGDLVITRDPDENWVNLAPYRAQIHDATTLGLMISPGHHGRLQLEKFWARGEDAPVVITGGQDPYTYAAACMPLGWGESEYDWAGAFAERPIDVIMEPRTGLPIPATAEIAVIGFVPPPSKEAREEGPFGECTGYYTGHGENMIVKVAELWHRNDPILQGCPTMHGTTMMHALGAEIFTSAVVWDTVDREVPGVTGVFSLYQPCQAGTFLLAVAIKQRYPGHAKHAALAALASRGTIFMNKAVVVVDDDIDPSNLEEVIFAITTRCNPVEDIDMLRGIPGTFLDPRIPPERRAVGDSTTSTMIVDACRPFTWRKDFPAVNIISRELKAKTIAKWGKRLGI